MADVRQQLDGVGGRETAPPGAVMELELVAFSGRPPQRVNVMMGAPFGWWAAIVLALSSLVDRVEQTILAGALPEIIDEFGLSLFQAGLLSTATAVAGAVMLFVVARLASSVNRTRALSLTLVAWAILSIGSGLAGTFVILLLMRALLGAASAFNNPLTGSLLGDYYPRAGRSRAYGADRLAFYLGGPIGIALGGALAQAYGWRAAFFVMAVPGVLVALLVLTLREPVRGISDRIDIVRSSSDPEIAAKLKAEADKVDEDAVLQKFKLFDKEIWNDFKVLLSIPTLRAVYIALAVLFFGLGGLFALTPTMFTRDYGLSTASAASLASAVGGTAVLVGFLIGFALGDRYQGRIKGWRILLASIGLGIGAAGTAVFGVGLPIVPTAVAWAILNVGIAISLPSLTAATSDLCGAERRGQAFALYALVTVGASALAPSVLGLLGDTFGSLQTAFLVTSPLLGLAALLCLRARATFDRDSEASLDDVFVPLGVIDPV